MKTFTVFVHGVSNYCDGTERSIYETFRVRADTPELAIEKAELKFGQIHTDADGWSGTVITGGRK